MVAVDVDGRLVARKPSTDDADAARLRHEAEVLTDARHPGVVELVTLESMPDGVALLTEFVGPHSLDTTGPLDVERAAGLVVSLAETVADLHDLGIVHGRIDRTHVVLGPGGRPVLCGFGGGGRIGTTPPPGPPAGPGFRDPVVTGDAALTPQVDVARAGRDPSIARGRRGHRRRADPRSAIRAVATPWPVVGLSTARAAHPSPIVPRTSRRSGVRRPDASPPRSTTPFQLRASATQAIRSPLCGLHLRTTLRPPGSRGSWRSPRSAPGSCWSCSASAASATLGRSRLTGSTVGQAPRSTVEARRRRHRARPWRVASPSRNPWPSTSTAMVVLTRSASGPTGSW